MKNKARQQPKNTKAIMTNNSKKENAEGELTDLEKNLSANSMPEVGLVSLQTMTGYFDSLEKIASSRVVKQLKKQQLYNQFIEWIAGQMKHLKKDRSNLSAQEKQERKDYIKQANEFQCSVNKRLTAVTKLIAKKRQRDESQKNESAKKAKLVIDVSDADVVEGSVSSSDWIVDDPNQGEWDCDRTKIVLNVDILSCILSFIPIYFERHRSEHSLSKRFVSYLSLRSVSKLFFKAVHQTPLLWSTPAELSLELRGYIESDDNIPCIPLVWVRRCLLFKLYKTTSEEERQALDSIMDQCTAIGKIINKDRVKATTTFVKLGEMAIALSLNVPPELINPRTTLYLKTNMRKSLFDKLVELKKTGPTILDCKRVFVDCVSTRFFFLTSRHCVFDDSNPVYRYEEVNQQQILKEISSSVEYLKFNIAEQKVMALCQGMVFPNVEKLKTTEVQNYPEELKPMFPNLRRTIWALAKKGIERIEEGKNDSTRVFEQISRMDGIPKAALFEMGNTEKQQNGYRSLMKRGLIYLHETEEGVLIVHPKERSYETDFLYNQLVEFQSQDPLTLTMEMSWRYQTLRTEKFVEQRRINVFQ